MIQWSLVDVAYYFIVYFQQTRLFKHQFTYVQGKDNLTYSGTLLIWSPKGHKNLAICNKVALLKEVFKYQND